MNELLIPRLSIITKEENYKNPYITDWKLRLVKKDGFESLFKMVSDGVLEDIELLGDCNTQHFSIPIKRVYIKAINAATNCKLEVGLFRTVDSVDIAIEMHCYSNGLTDTTLACTYQKQEPDTFEITAHISTSVDISDKSILPVLDELFKYLLHISFSMITENGAAIYNGKLPSNFVENLHGPIIPVCVPEENIARLGECHDTTGSAFRYRYLNDLYSAESAFKILLDLLPGKDEFLIKFEPQIIASMIELTGNPIYKLLSLNLRDCDTSVYFDGTIFESHEFLIPLIYAVDKLFTPSPINL